MVYCASPFFNEFERVIKIEMMESIAQHKELMSCRLFDPASTDNSKSYGKSPGSELAVKISEENINGIKSSKYLVYPELTCDIGTLMEVGVALKEGLIIYKYNYLLGTLTLVTPSMKEAILQRIPEVKPGMAIKVKSLSSAIVLGYHYDVKGIGYCLGKNMKDNIMLSVNFTRITPRGKVLVPNYKEVQ